MKKRVKIITWTAGILAMLFITIILICNQIVVNNAKGKVFSDIYDVKYNDVGLLLGTTPQARIGRITNYFFIYRIDAAEQLYKAGKIKKILISGDENSLDGINETECMRDSLVARSVPSYDILLDGKGYRTINSIVNANKVFGLRSFTIISQEFHNERAIYQAEHLGLDVEHIQGYNAKMPKSRRAFLTTIREYFARVKMFLDLLTFDESHPLDKKKSVWSLSDLYILHDTIYSFVGKPIVISDSVFTRISEVAAEDTKITYNSDSTLQIGGVKWQIKFTAYNMELFTSTKVDDPRMAEVIKYLSSIYGEPWTTEKRPNNYHWPKPFTDEAAQKTNVRLGPGCPDGSRICFEIGHKNVPHCGNAHNPRTWP
jgi:SanA protein